MKLVSLHVLSFLLSFEFRTLVLPFFTMFLLWVLLGFQVGSAGGNGHLKFRNNESSSLSVMSSPDALALRFLNFLSLAA